MSLPGTSGIGNSCNCTTQTTTTPTKAVEKKKPINIYTQAQQMQPPQQVAVTQQPCGASLGSGFKSLMGGIFNAFSGLAHGAAALSASANVGGMGLGELWLMSKMYKNNNCCHSYCGGSRPIVINTFRGYPLARRFLRPMPSRFSFRPAFCGPRPRPHFNRFNICHKPFGRNIC